MSQLFIVQPYLVLVRLPSRADRGFDTWASVKRVNAANRKEAIEKAIQEVGSELTEHVPPGEMLFFAIPLRDVPMTPAVVHPKEPIVI